MKVTVVGLAWGTAYRDEVPGWWESIQALNPACDDIVIAHHPDDDCGVRDLDCRLVDCRTRTPDAMVNAAIQTIDEGWVAVLAMDDRFYPDAFACIPDAEGFDVIANALRFKSHGFVNGSAPERMHSDPFHNHVMGTSWFTKEIWERVGGYPDVYWSDWGFWWKCHRHGARWFKPAGVQVLVNDVRSGRLSSEPNYDADIEMIKFINDYQPNGVK